MKKNTLLLTILIGCFFLLGSLEYPEAYRQKYPELLSRFVSLTSPNFQWDKGSNNMEYDYAYSGFTNERNLWARTYGGVYPDLPFSVQQTSDGGYIVAGLAKSFSDDGYADIWVLKLFPNGGIEWQKVYGTSSWDTAGSICQTADGGYIVAGQSRSLGAGGGDVWILKLFPDGEIEWQKTYGGVGGDSAHSVQQTIDGGYIVAGITRSFGAGSTDIWVLKLSPNGKIEWQKTYGGEGSDNVYDSSESVQQTTDGGYIVACTTPSFGAGKEDIWMLKLFPDGEIEWQKTYGGEGTDDASSVQQTTDGGYIVAGFTTSFGAGSTDIWILKLFPDGEIEWQKTYGGKRDDGHGAGYSISVVQQTAGEDYILASYTASFGAGGFDFWILKLTINGEIKWQKTYGGEDSDCAMSVGQIADGGYIVAGYTVPYVTKYANCLILKLSPNGRISALCEIIGRSKASVSDTAVSPSDTNVMPMDTNVTSQRTNVVPWESDATTTLLCMSLPDAPTGLEARAISWNKIELIWRDNSAIEEGFKVERKQVKKGRWEEVKTLKPNRRRHTDKGLKANRLYKYRVRALNSIGYSDYSNVAEAKTKKK